MHRMATMKRRVIYVSDDEWANWQREAAAEERTISDWVRFHVVDKVVIHDVARINGVVVGETRNVINPADRFNTRPFTPVPKGK